MPILLASTSASRRAMLEAAGVPFAAVAPGVDEAPLKAAMAGRPVMDIAGMLAEAKARAVSAMRPGALVIGSDSMVETGDGLWLDKPGDAAGLRAQLMALRGRAHRLISAVALARDGETRWRHLDAAVMQMRDFSDAFLEDYVAACGDRVCHSAGGYHLEGLGVQLFDAILGDHFTVRGLPLVPLLGQLRAMGALPA